jgi:hypothetical protein
MVVLEMAEMSKLAKSTKQGQVSLPHFIVLFLPLDIKGKSIK